MSIESKESFKNIPSIEAKINAIVTEIENEYKIWKKTLEKLIAFKLEKWKESISKETWEYKNALISEIKKEANSWEIFSQNNEILSEEQYQVLAEKLIEISKLREQTQSWIEELRAELIKDTFSDNFFTSKTLITKWLYSQGTLQKIDNPKWFSDNMIWFWVWTIETFAVIWKFSLETLKWIIKSPFDLIQLVKWDAKLETNIKI